MIKEQSSWIVIAWTINSNLIKIDIPSVELYYMILNEKNYLHSLNL